MARIRKVLCIYKNTNIVIKAGIWFFLVTIIDKGIAVITQPIINRILSVDQVGVFGVYTSWSSIFSVLATFNLFGGVLEVYLTKESDKKDRFVASLCTLSVFISSIFWMLFFAFGNRLSSLLGLKTIYLVLMALTITGEAIIQFWSVPKRFEYSYKSYAILIVGLFITKSVLSVILAFYIRHDRVLGRILGLAIPTMIVSVFLFINIFKNREKGGLIHYWKSGFLFNLPLIPHYLSSILLASSDRVMIQQLSAEADAGLYTVAYSYASLTLLVFNALSNAYNPLSMKAIKNENYSLLRKSTELIVFLSIVFSVFMMLLAPEGLWLLGGNTYLSTIEIIPVLIVGIFFSSFYFIFSSVEFVYEKNKAIFPITLAGALVNIVLNYFMIPIFGYKVAAYTTLAGYMLIAIAHYYVSKKIVGKDIYNIKKIVMYLFILFLGAVASMILYTLSNLIRYALISLTVVIGVFIIYKNKNEIIKMISKKTVM